MRELTPRETDVIKSIINDACFSVKKIALNMGITKRTAQSHLINIYDKLELPTRNIASLVFYYRSFREI